MNYIPTFFESDLSDIKSCEGHVIKFGDGDHLKDLTGGVTSHAVLGWADEDVIKVVTEQMRAYAHLDYKTFHDPLREVAGATAEVEHLVAAFEPNLFEERVFDRRDEINLSFQALELLSGVQLFDPVALGPRSLKLDLGL